MKNADSINYKTLTENLFNTSKPIISIDHVTKDYQMDRGNFDITFDVKEGETIGILGENGAGKTTLLRQMMGFIKSDKGSIHIYNLDAYKDSAKCKNYIAYIPGEINFPDYKTGNEFIKEYAKESSLGEESLQKADYVIKKMQLDITAYPRRMSKGMKQKTSIVACFMKLAPIILMDEPTTGLDPLMRDAFLDLVLEEKKNGTTIIMTSNIIEELEKVCDRVIFISKGRIIDIAELDNIRNRPLREYKIEFNNTSDYKTFLTHNYTIIRNQEKYNQVTIQIDKSMIEKMFHDLRGLSVKFLTEVPYTLQTYFDEKKSKL